MLRASLEKKNYWLLLGIFIIGLRIGEGVSNDLRSLGNNRLMREPALKKELEAWRGSQWLEERVNTHVLRMDSGRLARTTKWGRPWWHRMSSADDGLASKALRLISPVLVNLKPVANSFVAFNTSSKIASPFLNLTIDPTIFCSHRPHACPSYDIPFIAHNYYLTLNACLEII